MMGVFVCWCGAEACVGVGMYKNEMVFYQYFLSQDPQVQPQI